MRWREKRDPTYRVKTAEVEFDEYTVKGILASSRIDKTGERISPKALSDWAERRKDVPLHMFREHQRSLTIGQWDVLEVRPMEGVKNEVVLYGEGEMFSELGPAKEAKFLKDKGLLGEISVGFNFKSPQLKQDYIEFGWVDIKEASLVAFGANEDAKVMAEAFSVKTDNGEIDGMALSGLLALTDLNMEERQAILHAVATKRVVNHELDTGLALWRALT